MTAIGPSDPPDAGRKGPEAEADSTQVVGAHAFTAARKAAAPAESDATQVVGAAAFAAARQAADTVPPGAPPGAPPGVPPGTPPAPPPPSRPPQGTLSPGQLLAHTYEIQALLARGGMGEVYRARHAELGSLHAVKVIRPEMAADERIVTLFQEEARKLRRLRHDAIVAYEGLLRDESGLRFLVMEYVDGPSLAHVLRQRPLSVTEVRQLRDRCAFGLAAAHDKGVFHRDISPDNIILVEGRTELSKIIDFGIAKSTAPGDRTVVGHDFAGKYSYVSPEQLGMYGGAVDGRSDIYSLGLVLAAAARGRPLDMGSSPSSVIEARRAVPDLSDVPAELRPEIAPLLEPDPARRPASMRELPGVAIEGATGLSTQLTALTAAAAARPGRHRALAIGAGLAAFALVVVGGYVLLMPRPAVTPGPGPTGPGPAAPGPAEPRISPAAVEAQLAPLLTGYDCARLSVTVGDDLRATIKGFVSNAADVGRLRGATAAIAPGGVSTDAVATYVWPHCALAGLLADRTVPGHPDIAFNDPSAAYHDGQNLVLDLTVPADREGYLVVDYFDSGGTVVHMLPDPVNPTGKVARGQHVRLGNDGTPGSREPTYTVGTPYGPNMIVAVLAPRPLFDKARPQQEPAKDYLAALESRLKAAPAGELAGNFGFFDARP